MEPPRRKARGPEQKPGRINGRFDRTQRGFFATLAA
jgi:hypothetical protein